MTPETLQGMLPSDGLVDLKTGLPYARLIAYQRVLAAALGSRTGIEAELLVPTAGSMGGIEAVRNHLLMTAAGGPRTVLTVRPGYWRARQSFEGGGFEILEEGTAERGFDLDEERLLRRIADERPGLVYLSLPNNPTGAVFDAERLIRELPQGVPLLLDLTLPGAEDAVAEPLGTLHRAARGRKGIFFVGSTSKSHGTAEERVGWLACAHGGDAEALVRQNRNVVAIPAIRRALEEIGSPAPAMAEIHASYALLERAEADGLLELVRPRRRVETCYVLLRPSVADPAALARSLESEGVRVMPGAGCGVADDLFRVELSESRNVARLTDVLESLLSRADRAVAGPSG